MTTKRDRLEGDFLVLIRRGLTVREACGLLGIHRSTGQRWLKRIGDAEPRAKAPVRQKDGPWWDDPDPEIRAIRIRQRDRLVELHPDVDVDDPRCVFGLAPSFHPERDDAVLMALHKELLAVRIRRSLPA